MMTALCYRFSLFCVFVVCFAVCKNISLQVYPQVSVRHKIIVRLPIKDGFNYCGIVHISALKPRNMADIMLIFGGARSDHVWW